MINKKMITLDDITGDNISFKKPSSLGEINTAWDKLNKIANNKYSNGDHVTKVVKKSYWNEFKQTTSYVNVLQFNH